MRVMKKIIKGFFRQVFGLEICLSKNLASSAARHSAMRLVASLQQHGIDLLLDVGANTGQFAAEIRRCGYAGKIISFEPLSQAYAELQQASARDPLWHAYPRCALGDHDGDAKINIAGNSESSSILPMLELHRSAAPQSAYSGEEAVALKTLDSVAGPALQDARAVFLKIDVQGFEWQVLDGARQILPHVKGILVELSLAPLYEGQRLWKDVLDRLEREGFAVWAFNPVFSDPISGRTLQVDGVFFRHS